MRSNAVDSAPSTSKMSEEQSGFKVTDRRLFNSDGTPREIEREETPAPPAANATANASAATAAEKESAAPEAAPDAAATASPAEDSRGAQAESSPSTTSATAGGAFVTEQPEESMEEDYGESDIPGAHDPASFINFLMSIASNAAAALGMMEHPVTGQRGVDLPLGKHWIDVLGMLEEKTRGNLSPQEQQIFTGLLSDLRMQYVSLTRSTAPKRPGGFTASDILGGK
ncbi:MAG: hypothetical protein QOF02_2603 [Blastocatellia bacterium]|jgi:hypothetical protein|nr:hypothetical protein [Blastocatellia bacterium]